MSPVRRCKTWFGGVVPNVEQEKGRRPGPAPERRNARFEGLEGRIPGAECKENRAVPAQSLQRLAADVCTSVPGFSHHLYIDYSRGINFLNTPHRTGMRSRERILSNLETLYRESYDRAKKSADEGRLIELESGYMRDQLMLEILLDIRDLFSVAPAASGGSALEKLEALRRLTKLR